MCIRDRLCIHFTNSKTHDSNKVDSYHTEAIEYALSLIHISSDASVCAL